MLQRVQKVALAYWDLAGSFWNGDMLLEKHPNLMCATFGRTWVIINHNRKLKYRQPLIQIKRLPC